MMRGDGKHRFANYLCHSLAWGKSSLVEIDSLTDAVIISDGGMLMQNLVSLWVRGKTLGLISDDYVSHLIRETRTSHESIVVLDGYTEVTTKVHIQRQRNPCQTLDIVVHGNTVLDITAK